MHRSNYCKLGAYIYGHCTDGLAPSALGESYCKVDCPASEGAPGLATGVQLLMPTEMCRLSLALGTFGDKVFAVQTHTTPVVSCTESVVQCSATTVVQFVQITDQALSLYNWGYQPPSLAPRDVQLVANNLKKACSSGYTCHVVPRWGDALKNILHEWLINSNVA